MSTTKKSSKYSKILIYLSAILLSLIIVLNLTRNAISLEDRKKEAGIYFSTKIYEERHPVDNSFFMSQDGYMLGLVYSSETYEGLYSGLKGRLGAGEVDYTSAGTGTMTGIPDYQAEFTSYLGMPINLESSRLTFFSGIGYRYLLNASGLKQSSTGHYGYDRESQYAYVPLGVNYEKQIDRGRHWEIRGEYLYFLYGKQKSYLSQVAPQYPDISNDQEEGSGIKISAKYYLDQNSGFEGYMDYWDIADSKLDQTGNFMEPRNSTSETGIRFFWKFD